MLVAMASAKGRGARLRFGRGAAGRGAAGVAGGGVGEAEFRRALEIARAAGARPRGKRERPDDKSNGEGPNEAKCRDFSRRTLLARQLTKSTVLSAQISTLDTSADLPSAYFPRRST